MTTPRKIEEVLAEALRARAELVTQESLRPALPPKRPGRRHLRLVATAVPLTMAAALTGLWLGSAFTEGPQNTVAPASPGKPAVAESPSPAPSQSTPPKDSVGRTVDQERQNTPPASSRSTASLGPLNGLKLTVPAGWRRTWNARTREICVIQIDNARPCDVEGVNIEMSPPVDDANAAETLAPFEHDWGWQHLSAGWICDDPENNPVSETTGGRRTFAPVGGKTAYRFDWQVRCHDGSSYTPRVWYLPRTGLLIRSLGVDPQQQQDVVEPLVRGLGLGGYRPPAR